MQTHSAGNFSLCAPTTHTPSDSWFLQNPHLPPGSVVMVAAADADWNPRPLHERFDTSDGRLVPATGGLGDLYVLARVWPSAVLRRKDLYLRGRTSDMLGRLDEKRVLLIAPGEGRGKKSHRRDTRSNADGDGDGAEAEGEGEERDGYADAVDVRIVMLEASGGDEERVAASTPNKQAAASTTTPSRGGTGAKFVAMSPSMRQSVGQEPSPLFLNSVDRGSGGGREGGRSSERKKKKGKSREEQEPDATVPPAASGGASSSSPLPSLPSLPSSAVEDALAKHGSRTNAVLQAVFRSALRDTWLLQGSMCPIPFLDSRLGAVVTSKQKGGRPFRIGRATRIVLRVGGGSGDDGASAVATSSNDINYADAAVASLREDGSGVDVDASIVSSVHKAATAVRRSTNERPAARPPHSLGRCVLHSSIPRIAGIPELTQPAARAGNPSVGALANVDHVPSAELRGVQGPRHAAADGTSGQSRLASRESLYCLSRAVSPRKFSHDRSLPGRIAARAAGNGQDAPGALGGPRRRRQAFHHQWVRDYERVPG